MKARWLFILCSLMACVCFGQETNLSLTEIRTRGAFDFPQEKAKILYNQPELRFSVWNNNEFLFAQAILWTDTDASSGKNSKGTEIGDWSDLVLDVDSDQKPTAHTDRTYILNPYPNMPGLYYTVDLGDFSTTSMSDESHGRGVIRHIKTTGGRNVRIDTYLIPLSEIAKKAGDKIRLGYWGYSFKPSITVNSSGYAPVSHNYYSYQIPYSLHRDYVLLNNDEKLILVKFPTTEKLRPLQNNAEVCPEYGRFVASSICRWG